MLWIRSGCEGRVGREQLSRVKETRVKAALRSGADALRCIVGLLVERGAHRGVGRWRELSWPAAITNFRSLPTFAPSSEAVLAPSLAVSPDACTAALQSGELRPLLSPPLPPFHHAAAAFTKPPLLKEHITVLQSIKGGHAATPMKRGPYPY